MRKGALSGFFASLLHAVVTGLVGAALLHLVIVLALPRFSEHDAYARVLGVGPPERFHLLKKEDGPLAPEDPFVSVAVCAYDLSAAPVYVTAAGRPAFWSFAAFDKGSNEIFSINDRSVDEAGLDAVIATPAQAAQLRRAEPDLTERSILVETAEVRGYLVLRALAPHASMEKERLDFLGSARCGPARPS